MEYVTLPGTDLKVSRICLGTMQFAGSVEAGTTDVTWGAMDQPTVNATVKAALEARPSRLWSLLVVGHVGHCGCVA